MPMAAGPNLRLEWWLRNPRSERGMRASTIVVGNEFFQNEAKVLFVHRYDAVQTLSTNCPCQSFAVGVRFWGLDRRSRHAHSEIMQRRIERGRKDRIAIVNHEPVRMQVRENLAELLRRPFCRGMLFA